jgi:hypothetical protein
MIFIVNLLNNKLNFILVKILNLNVDIINIYIYYIFNEFNSKY